MLAAVPGATILRPSVVFGPEDDFFNKFAALARFAPALPLIGGGAHPLPAGVRRRRRGGVRGRGRGPQTKPGTTYELGGPEVLTFKELMEFVLATIERRRLLVPIPFGLAKLQAAFLQFMPKPLLTPDQVELLRRDNVVSDGGDARQPHARRRSASSRPRCRRSCRPICGASAAPASSSSARLDSLAAG